MQKPLHVESGNAHLSHSHIVKLLGVRAYVIGISPFNSCLGQIMVPSARRSVRGIVIQILTSCPTIELSSLGSRAHDDPNQPP
jgi:hypothetical protein